MRNIVFGTIGLLWGAGIIIMFFARGAPAGGGAYVAGSWMGLVFGICMILAGGLALVSGVQAVANPPREPRPRKRRRKNEEDNDEDDRPRSRSRQSREDDEDDRPRRRRSRDDEDEEDERPRPRRRRPRDEDE